MSNYGLEKFFLSEQINFKRASVLARGLKQDINFKTEILENRKVLINNQFIGQLNGLKLELDFKIGALDTDIKSLKKAAKQNVEPEILNRIRQIKWFGMMMLNFLKVI